MRALFKFETVWQIGLWVGLVLVGVACVPTTMETAVLPTAAATAVLLDADGQPMPTATATAAERVLPPTSTPIPTQKPQHFAEVDQQEVDYQKADDQEEEDTAVLLPTATATTSIMAQLLPTQAAKQPTPQPTMSPNTITTDQDAWLTYESTSKGFTMRYPAEFSLEELDIENFFGIAFSLGGNLSIDTAADIYHYTGLSFQMLPLDYINSIPDIDLTEPSLLVEKHLQESELFEAEIIQPITHTTIAGQPAATALVHRYTTTGGKIQQAFYFAAFVINDHMAMAIGSMATHEEVTTLPIFKAMIDTIEFE